MKKYVLFTFILMGLSTLTAQEPPRDHGPNPMEVLNRFFSFDEAQVTQLQTLFEARRTQMDAIHTELRTTRQAIADILHSEDPDATALGNLMIIQKDLGYQRKALFEAFHADFLSMLNEEQTRKYNSLVRADHIQVVVRAAKSLKIPLFPPEPPEED